MDADRVALRKETDRLRSERIAETAARVKTPGRHSVRVVMFASCHLRAKSTDPQTTYGGRRHGKMYRDRRFKRDEW